MQEHSCLWYIKKLDFFPEISEQDLLECALSSVMVGAKRGEVIALPKDTAEHAWLIKEGHVRLVRHTAEGRTIAVEILGPGEIIGEVALITGEAAPESAEAMDEVLLCKVSGGLLRRVCERNPELGLHIAKRVGQRRVRIETRLADLLFHPVPARVANLLLNLHGRFANLRLTHQEIADLVGCNREAATRAVDSLLDRRLIGYEGRTIRIHDMAGLRAFCRGEPMPV